MQLRKYRWSRHYESAEEELLGFLQARDIDAERWTAEAGDDFAAHQHAKDKQLFCAEGSITLTVDGKSISMQPGDALELPAGAVHSAIAGMTGVVCYESPHPAENPAIPA